VPLAGNERDGSDWPQCGVGGHAQARVVARVREGGHWDPTGIPWDRAGQVSWCNEEGRLRPTRLPQRATVDGRSYHRPNLQRPWEL
jgi:hypothetical protein